MSGTATIRVTHLVTTNAFAGLERHVLRLAAKQRSLGAEVTVACPPKATRMRDEAAACDVPIIPATRHLWLAAVAAEIIKQPPQILHAHDGRGAALMAAMAPVLPSVLVRSQHFVRPGSVERPGLAGAGSRMAHRLINRRLAGYVAVSGSVAEFARGRNETGRAKVRVIAPGVTPPKRDAVDRAVELRRNAPGPIVSFAGRIEPERRLETLVEAAPGILREVPECRFVVAGDGTALPELKLQARRLGVASKFEWPGWVAEPDEVLARSHVFVNTLPWEGYGMAMAEAQGYALPVVATTTGASPELVEDGETGILVPPTDAAALQEALIRLTSDRPYAEQLGTKARESAVRHTMDNTAVRPPWSSTKSCWRIAMTGRASCANLPQRRGGRVPPAGAPAARGLRPRRAPRLPAAVVGGRQHGRSAPRLTTCRCTSSTSAGAGASDPVLVRRSAGSAGSCARSSPTSSTCTRSPTASR